MNHGRTVYIGHNAIHLTEDLLRPLSIVEDSSVSGIYYPPPTDSDYTGVWPRHDLVLTPIPFFKWPFVASMKIRILHKPGIIAELAEFLDLGNINILNAQCTRSGHRHATWSLVVEFNTLHTKEATNKDYDVLTKSLDSASNRLSRQLISKFRHVLFNSGKWHDPRKPVEVRPLRALLYFYEQQRSRRDTEILHLRCEENGLIKLEESILGDKVPASELPTLGLATMDTEFFNIRVAILPRRQLSRFRLLMLEYQLNKMEAVETSQGLFSTVVSRLRPEGVCDQSRVASTGSWNLWRVYNQTRRNDEAREVGKMVLSMQHLDDDPKPTQLEELTKSLEVLASTKYSGRLTAKVKTLPLAARRLFLSLRNKEKFSKRDDVIRFCEELGEEIGILRDEIVVFDSHVTPSVTEDIKKKMQGCTGMLQFFMFQTEAKTNDTILDTDWLNGEYFLSTAIPIPCVRIVDPKLLPRVIFGKDHPALLLSETAGDEEFKKCIKEALSELDKKMGGRP